MPLDFDLSLDLGALDIGGLDLDSGHDLLDDVERVGDVEKDSAAELSAIESGFRARMEAESKRRQKVTDSAYYVCACFQTREQSDAFLQACGGHLDSPYLDGRKVAKLAGIQLPPDGPDFPKPRPVNRRLAALARKE